MTQVNDSLVEMISSPNDEDRRMGLTILFNQWDEISGITKNDIKMAYFKRLTETNISLVGNNKYKHYKHFDDNRTLRQMSDDLGFVVEHVCQDDYKLSKIFIFDVSGAIRDAKIRKLNNERQTKGDNTGTITN
jgi:hypothetical protein